MSMSWSQSCHSIHNIFIMLPSVFSTSSLGSLSNDDGKGNESGWMSHNAPFLMCKPQVSSRAELSSSFNRLGTRLRYRRQCSTCMWTGTTVSWHHLNYDLGHCHMYSSSWSNALDTWNTLYLRSLHNKRFMSQERRTQCARGETREEENNNAPVTRRVHCSGSSAHVRPQMWPSGESTLTTRFLSKTKEFILRGLNTLERIKRELLKERSMLKLKKKTIAGCEIASKEKQGRRAI